MKGGREMVCVKPAAEPSFGQLQAIEGAVLSEEEEDGEAGFLSEFLPLTWGGERLLHNFLQMLSAAQPCHCCSLAGGEGGSGS